MIYLTFTNTDNKNILRTQDCRTTRQNNCTYERPLKHTNTKNNHEHNNTSWKEIRISAQEHKVNKF